MKLTLWLSYYLHIHWPARWQARRELKRLGYPSYRDKHGACGREDCSIQKAHSHVQDLCRRLKEQSAAEAKRAQMRLVKK